MSYDYNEAKELYENGFIDFSFSEMIAFAKYSIYELGKSTSVTEKEMIKILKEKGYNVVKNSESIHKACLYAKNSLDKETTVKITNSEIEKIKEVREDYRKILFCALFIAKKDRSSDYYNRDIQDAINLSGVKFTEDEKNKLYSFLKDWIPMILGRSSRKILFSKDEDKNIFAEINKKENPMPYFPRYCRECGNLMGKNERKYCWKCSKIVRFEKEKIRKR